MSISSIPSTYVLRCQDLRRLGLLRKDFIADILYANENVGPSAPGAIRCGASKYTASGVARVHAGDQYQADDGKTINNGIGIDSSNIADAFAVPCIQDCSSPVATEPVRSEQRQRLLLADDRHPFPSSAVAFEPNLQF